MKLVLGLHSPDSDGVTGRVGRRDTELERQQASELRWRGEKGGRKCFHREAGSRGNEARGELWLLDQTPKVWKAK